MNYSESFIETKYFLQFHLMDEYIDISGEVEKYAVTKAGKILLLPQRNRDFTLKTSTFTINVFSITEITRGMRFKITRNDVVILKGFVDDVSYDEDKNEYSVKIAHEFKLLQNYKISKTELETVLTSNKVTYILKTLFERIIDSEIDFSIADAYIPKSIEDREYPLSYVKYPFGVLWCFGLDYASSKPDEQETGTYWQLFSQLMGAIGCIVYWDGLKYVVKHYTQVENINDNNIFLDKFKKTFTPIKKNYVGVHFVANYNSDLTTYNTEEKTDLEDTYNFTGIAQTGSLEVSNINNLVPYYIKNPGVNWLGDLNINGKSSPLINGNGEKYYIAPYYKYNIDTDFTSDFNKCISKSYDPVKEIMSIEYHEIYQFYISRAWDETIITTGNVYVSFTQELDQTALKDVDVYEAGVKISATKSFYDNSTIKIGGIPLGSYRLKIRRDIKSKEQASLLLVDALSAVNFDLTNDVYYYDFEVE